MVATIGDDADVPPYTAHLPALYTATPVFGSATAATSATVRLAQLVSFCHVGLAEYAEQPEPAPPLVLAAVPHTVSTQPRAFAVVLVNPVPPTAITLGDAAGYPTP